MNNTKTINILLIEDNPGDVRLIRELLNSIENFPYTIKEIMGLEELNATDLGSNFDIILSDLNIPGSSGIETFEIIKSIFPDIPIIVQTGLNDKELGALAVSKGAQDYLVKGRFEEQLLHKTILYGIERNNLSKRLRKEMIKNEREKIFKEIVENSPVGIYRSAPNGKLLLANQALIKMLGFNSADEINVLARYENKEKREEFKKLVEKHGAVSDYEEKWKKKDGSIIFIQESCRIVKDNNGNILYYEGTVEDISKRKEAEKKVLLYNKKLEKLNSDKDKFFSIIAHDLTKPFNSLLGMNKIMIEDYNEMVDTERITFLREIESASQNAYSLLQDLLHWSRSQMDGVLIKKDKINLFELAEKNFKLVKQAAVNKGIDIKISIHPSLHAYADYNMVDAVLRNLLSNAVKYTYKRGSIAIFSSFNANNLVLTIADSGCGMKDEVKKNLFSLESRQSISGTEGEEGTGLGLIFSKEYVEKNGGKIWAESELGKGSKFHFSLPVFKSNGKSEEFMEMAALSSNQ